MSMFSVNMAVPVKENVRESKIYFLANSENAPQEGAAVDKIYFTFKTLELITLICALILYANGIRADENEIGDVLRYIVVSAVTAHPLLFILFSVNTNQRPVLSILCNTLSMTVLCVIGVTTLRPLWYNLDYHNPDDREKYSTLLMQIRSSCLLLISGLLYLVESIVMFVQIGKYYCNNN